MSHGLFTAPEEDPNALKKGDMIHHVRNDELAAALIAVGVPLWNNAQVKPFLHVEDKKGSDTMVYNFKGTTSDGLLKTGKLIEAFTQDLVFIEKNPQHPFAYALCAVKSLQRLKEKRGRHVPYVGFKSTDDFGNPATLLIKKGSDKHKNAVARGMTQV